MALPIRIARAIVGVKAETTAGTFLEPGATEAFHCENITIEPSSPFYQPNPTRAHFGRVDSIPAGAEVTISFEVLLVGGSTAGAAAPGVAPFWDAAMMGCGHQKTIVATTSVAYKPSTKFDGSTASGTTQPSEGYSVCVWDEGPGGAATGPRYAATGSQGNVSFSTKQGEGLRLKFSMKGAYVATVDDASIPAVTDSPLLPPTFLSAQITVHANAALEFEGFEFDKGNVISKRLDAGHSAGLKGFWITEHKPTIKANPNMVNVASFDYYGKWRSGATGNFTHARVGATAGNRYTFTAGRTQINDLGHGEREGARTTDLTLNITTAYNAADGDDYTLLID